MTIFVTGCFSASLLWAANPEKLKVSVTLQAATIDLEADEELSFGTLVPEAGKKAKVVLDASAGPATQITLTKGKVAVIEEAQSGLLTVESDVEAELKIAYTVNDTPGGTGNDDELKCASNDKPLVLTGKNVKKYSTSTLAVKPNEEAQIHVGGLLEIPEDVNLEEYSGEIEVTVSY